MFVEWIKELNWRIKCHSSAPWWSNEAWKILAGKFLPIHSTTASLVLPFATKPEVPTAPGWPHSPDFFGSVDGGGGQGRHQCHKATCDSTIKSQGHHFSGSETTSCQGSWGLAGLKGWLIWTKHTRNWWISPIIHSQSLPVTGKRGPAGAGCLVKCVSHEQQPQFLVAIYRFRNRALRGAEISSKSQPGSGRGGIQTQVCLTPRPCVALHCRPSDLEYWVYWVSQVPQWQWICLPMQETRVGSLSGEAPLEKEMAIHSRILPGKCHGQRSLAGYSPWVAKSWMCLIDQTTATLVYSSEKTKPMFLFLFLQRNRINGMFIWREQFILRN